MPKKPDLMNLPREELETLLWNDPKPDRDQRDKLQAMLSKRDGLIKRMSLCRGCEQIKVAQYPRKYCYVTCQPPFGNPVSELIPEDEAAQRVFDSKPTTRMLAMKLQEWSDKYKTDTPAKLTGMPKRQDFRDLTGDDIKKILFSKEPPNSNQENKLWKTLLRRHWLIDTLNICRDCEQITNLGFPWKYCYVTCTAPGRPDAALRPQDEATRRVFNSSPTTRMLEEMLKTRAR